MRRTKSANYTTTLTSKYQLTVPAVVCRAKRFRRGDRFIIYARGREEFVARLKRPSGILEFASDLQYLDTPKPAKPMKRGAGG